MAMVRSKEALKIIHTVIATEWLCYSQKIMQSLWRLVLWGSLDWLTEYWDL